MRKLVPAVVVLVSAAFAAALAGAQDPSAQSEVQLPKRMTVYVGVLAGPDVTLARKVRAKLVDDLTRRGIALVESEEEADAILTGSGVQETTKRPSFGRRASVCVRGELRLVSREGVVLWVGDVFSDRYALSEAASFAYNAGRKIAEALALAGKRKATSSAMKPVKGAA